MLLVADVGNTETTIGLFDGDALHSQWRLTTDVPRTPDEFALLIRALLDAKDVSPGRIRGAAIGSVVPGITAILSDAFGAVTGSRVRTIDGRSALPIRLDVEGLQIKQGTMREHHDGRRLGKSRQVFLEPRQLLGADLRFGPGHIVECDKMDSAVVKRVIGLLQEIPVQSAAIQPRIVLARNAFDQRHIQPPTDFEELLHAPGMDVFVFTVVGQVSGEQHQIGTLRQPVDHFHRTLKRFGSQGVGRAVEPYVRIAELNERERRHPLAVLFSPGIEHRAHFAAGGRRGHGRIQDTNAQ